MEKENTLIIKFWFDGEDNEIIQKEYETQFCKSNNRQDLTFLKNNKAELFFGKNKKSYVKKVDAGGEQGVELSLFLRAKFNSPIDKNKIKELLSFSSDKKSLVLRLK